MTPLQIALSLLGFFIQQEPTIAADISSLLQKGDPSEADWQTLHDTVAAKVYAPPAQPVAIRVLPDPAPVVPEAAIPAAVPQVDQAPTVPGAGAVTATVQDAPPVAPVLSPIGKTSRNSLA
jgi:hypothetical protein